ncbi:hypothetical protein K435DRAFT_757570 [Dendrothele bispora CBS 962.96]|uniref:E2 ubiquitin-conjugating enzyme n=1 Tax=Dendrothele bispora (strain CBS 962.96) TaxID=1314807 RepID=A0A4S8LUL4_DENBC|nr:hypothetical protein K435DRAFT_757570 [Dendrothele bispora CBS 962.96]
MTLKRIHKEVADLKREDLGAITLAPSEDSLFLWRGTIPGPEGSVYEGGVFKVEVQLTGDYPFSSPRVVFKTRIYHMNISERGDICIDILKHNWSPALSLFKVMLSLSSLLTDPNPKDPLVSSIANQYVTNRKLHDSTARQWTELYAKPKTPPPTEVFTIVTPPTSITTAPTPAAAAAGKEKGKQKMTAVSETSGGGSSDPSSTAGSSRHTPVVIDDEDSDDGEQGKGKGKAERAEHKRENGTGKKRKRPSPAPRTGRVTGGSSTPVSVSLDVVDTEDVEDSRDDGDDDEVEIYEHEPIAASTASSSRKRTAKPSGGIKGRRVIPKLDERDDKEVIVVEDD